MHGQFHMNIPNRNIINYIIILYESKMYINLLKFYTTIIISLLILLILLCTCTCKLIY